MSEITIQALDGEGSFAAYVAEPASPPRAAIVVIHEMLGEKHGIAHPLLPHIAINDHFVPPDIQARMHEGLDDPPRVTLIDHPGVDHGFATETGNRRSPAEAERADKQTADFFAKNLG